MLKSVAFNTYTDKMYTEIQLPDPPLRWLVPLVLNAYILS